MDVAEGILFVALGCGRLPGMLDVSAKRPFVVLGTMDGQVLASMAGCLRDAARDVPVYFYETGWISPRRLVAVGKLDKIWFAVSGDVPEEQLPEAFRNYFGAEWDEVLDASDKSFAYNAANNAYFSVRDLRPVNNLTLEELLEEKGPRLAPNIIAS